MKDKLKEAIANIKNIYKNSKSVDEMLEILENTYERISNQKDKDYDLKYNVLDIFKGDTLKELKFVIGKNTKEIIVFEFVKPLNLDNLVLIYNKILDNLQTNNEIYIL